MYKTKEGKKKIKIWIPNLIKKLFKLFKNVIIIRSKQAKRKECSPLFEII